VAQVFDVWYNKITMIELFAEWYIFETPIAIKKSGEITFGFSPNILLWANFCADFLRPGKD